MSEIIAIESVKETIQYIVVNIEKNFFCDIINHAGETQTEKGQKPLRDRHRRCHYTVIIAYRVR